MSNYLLINSFMMTLFLSICFCASALRFFILFFDSGSLNCFSISSMRAFSYLIYFLVNKTNYFDELFLFLDFLLDRVLNISTDLFLHEVIFMFDLLDLYQTFFIRLIERSCFLAQKRFTHIFRHCVVMKIRALGSRSLEVFLVDN